MRTLRFSIVKELYCKINKLGFPQKIEGCENLRTASIAHTTVLFNALNMLLGFARGDGFERVIRPRVFGVASFHIFFDIVVGGAPKACEVLGDL